MENNSKETEIQSVLDTMRPMIQMDGGDISFVSFDEETSTVLVQMQGACVNCSMSQVTLKMGIEEELKRRLPYVKFVESAENYGND